MCRCGHVRLAHEHYRRGTDCALCDCPRYRDAARWIRLATWCRALRPPRGGLA